MHRLASLTHFFLGLVLFSIAGGDTAMAAVNRLPDDARTALLKEHFVTIKKVSQIPSAGMAAFHAGQDDHDLNMADPGGHFQAPDSVKDHTLPLRQLQFAALSPDYLLISNARGGNGLGYYFVLLKKSGDSFKVVWVGEGSRYSSFRRFLRALKANAIDDREGYAY
jgi:hypothetical protein